MSFHESKGYSVRNLKYMAKFAEAYPDRGSEIYSVEELKHIIWVYYMSYWNNRRICHSIGGLPPAVKRKRYLDAANVAAG